MSGIAGQEQSSVEESPYCAALDEGYWQALLEQGEAASETAPCHSPQEFFYPQDTEAEAGTKAFPISTGGGSEITLHGEWQIAETARNRGVPFTLTVAGANRGGLLVEWNGLPGFVPASQLNQVPRCPEPRDRMAELVDRVGQSLTVCLIEVDPRQERLVFSERAAVKTSEPASTVLRSLSPGGVCDGTVTSLTSFGAFVDLGGIEGLIHISELSWDRVRHPSDVLRRGQEVQVRVLSVKLEEKRVALSLKRLRPDPWSDVDSRYRAGQVIEGTVTNVVGFGAFVRVAEGLEGLVHISELAEGSFLHPRDVVREGDQVWVRVLNVDRAQHRMGLSLRQVRDANAPFTG